MELWRKTLVTVTTRTFLGAASAESARPAAPSRNPRDKIPESLDDGADQEEALVIGNGDRWFMESLHLFLKAHWDHEPARRKGPLSPALSPSEGERENRRRSVCNGRFMENLGMISVFMDTSIDSILI